MDALWSIVLLGKLLVSQEFRIHTPGRHILSALFLLDSVGMSLVGAVVCASVLLLLDVNEKIRQVKNNVLDKGRLDVSLFRLMIDLEVTVSEESRVIKNFVSSNRVSTRAPQARALHRRTISSTRVSTPKCKHHSQADRSLDLHNCIFRHGTFLREDQKRNQVIGSCDMRPGNRYIHQNYSRPLDYQQRLAFSVGHYATRIFFRLCCFFSILPLLNLPSPFSPLGIRR